MDYRYPVHTLTAGIALCRPPKSDDTPVHSTNFMKNDIFTEIEGLLWNPILTALNAVGILFLIFFTVLKLEDK